MNSNNLTTTFGLIASVTEILIEFEYIDKRIGGVIIALNLLGWSYLTNNLQSRIEENWRKK